MSVLSAFSFSSEALVNLSYSEKIVCFAIGLFIASYAGYIVLNTASGIVFTIIYFLCNF